MPLTLAVEAPAKTRRVEIISVCGSDGPARDVFRQAQGGPSASKWHQKPDHALRGTWHSYLRTAALGTP